MQSYSFNMNKDRGITGHDYNLGIRYIRTNTNILIKETNRIEFDNQTNLRGENMKQVNTLR